MMKRCKNVYKTMATKGKQEVMERDEISLFGERERETD
jgi:hypothetical protein